MPCVVDGWALQDTRSKTAFNTTFEEFVYAQEKTHGPWCSAEYDVSCAVAFVVLDLDPDLWPHTLMIIQATLPFISSSIHENLKNFLINKYCFSFHAALDKQTMNQLMARIEANFFVNQHDNSQICTNNICIQAIGHFTSPLKFLLTQHKIYQPSASGQVLASIPYRSI